MFCSQRRAATHRTILDQPALCKSQLELGKRYRINRNWGRVHVKDFERLGRRPRLFQIKSCSGGFTFISIPFHVLVPASQQTHWVAITKTRTGQRCYGQSLRNYFLRNTGVPRHVNRCCSVNNIENPPPKSRSFIIFSTFSRSSRYYPYTWFCTNLSFCYNRTHWADLFFNK